MGLRPCLISWNSWLLNPPQGVRKQALTPPKVSRERRPRDTMIFPITLRTKVNILNDTDEKQGETKPKFIKGNSIQIVPSQCICVWGAYLRSHSSVVFYGSD